MDQNMNKKIRLSEMNNTLEDVRQLYHQTVEINDQPNIHGKRQIADEDVRSPSQTFNPQLTSTPKKDDTEDSFLNFVMQNQRVRLSKMLNSS